MMASRWMQASARYRWHSFSQALAMLLAIVLVMLLVIVLVIVLMPGWRQDPPTDYQQDMSVLTNMIINTNQLVQQATPGSAAQHQHIWALAGLYHKKAALTGDYQDHKQLEGLLNKARLSNAQPIALAFALASFNASMHRFYTARDIVYALPEPVRQSPEFLGLLADIALQLGQYPQAMQRLQTLVVQYPRWDNLARLAYFELNTGEIDKARQHYQRAANQLSSKQMYQYAWVNLQLGLLELELGNFAQSLAYYNIADNAYSGHWLIQEHRGEVLALMGNKQQAIALYRRIITTNPAPQLLIALAKLVKDPNEKRDLYNRAMTKAKQAQQVYPQALAGHLIEGLLTSETSSADLLTMAKLNLEARPNTDAKVLLAKVYLKFNMITQAQALAQQVAHSPWQNRQTRALTQITKL